MNEADKKIKEYLERAKKLLEEVRLGFSEEVYKTWEVEAVVEIAKMIQREEKK